MFKLLLVLLLSVGTTLAGTVDLKWEDNVNAAGTTYSVYRSTSPCSSAVAFVKIITSISAKTYTNLNVAAGTYCYAVTASRAGVESVYSNKAEIKIETATLPPTPPLSPPTALTATER